MHLTDDEQRRSPLYRVLPRRTTRIGVKPGASAKPKHDENWMYSAKEMTELEERLVVATSIQIEILTMMSTHSQFTMEIGEDFIDMKLPTFLDPSRNAAINRRVSRQRGQEQQIPKKPLP
jgi:hypothetical protein